MGSTGPPTCGHGWFLDSLDPSHPTMRNAAGASTSSKWSLLLVDKQKIPLGVVEPELMST